MLTRNIQSALQDALAGQAAVAFFGPSQVGKTTRALARGAQQDAPCTDLEGPTERGKLAHAAQFLQACQDLQPSSRFVVHAGVRRFRVNAEVAASGLAAMAALLALQR